MKSFAIGAAAVCLIGAIMVVEVVVAAVLALGAVLIVTALVL